MTGLAPSNRISQKVLPMNHDVLAFVLVITNGQLKCTDVSTGHWHAFMCFCDEFYLDFVDTLTLSCSPSPSHERSI